MFQPKSEHHAPPKAGEAVVWLPPLKPNKPTPQAAQPAQKQSAKTAPSKPRQTPPRANVQRLPDTITLPHEKPVEQPKPQPKEETKLQPDETDMAAYIESAARPAACRASSRPRRAKPRAAPATRWPTSPPSTAAAARIRTRAGGVFSVTNKTFSHADVKFRGWNPNFKRRWLTSASVDRGSEPDIETAIVKKMIELIRKEKQGDFEWDSHRLNKVVTLSRAAAGHEGTEDFLYKEMFPDYKPPK